MSIRVESNIKEKEDNELFDQRAHYMPCRIDEDGPADVKQYFEPYVKEADGRVLKATFRGHPLCGTKTDLPPGYRAILATETKKPLSEDADRRFQVVSGFRTCIRWQWDKEPTDNDTLVRVMDWIDIANAIHED